MSSHKHSPQPPQPPAQYQGKTCIHDGAAPAFYLTTIRTSGWSVRNPLTGPKYLYGARASSLLFPPVTASEVGGLHLGDWTKGSGGTNLPAHLECIVDMSGQITPKTFAPFVKLGSPNRNVLNAAAAPRVISLNWPDMTAPWAVRADFWHKLMLTLPAHTCFTCAGSHGRTGTALACMLVTAGMTSEAAISAVRDIHCHHAVETPGQVGYIQRVAKQFDTAGIIRRQGPLTIKGVLPTP